MLLRKNSPIYSHFSDYLAQMQAFLNPEGRSPMRAIMISGQAAKRVIASPKTPSKSKLVPLALINRCTSDNSGQLPHDPKSPFRENETSPKRSTADSLSSSGSILKQIMSPATTIKVETPTQRQPPAEDQKKAVPPASKATLNANSRGPWIDTRNVGELSVGTPHTAANVVRVATSNGTMTTQSLPTPEAAQKGSTYFEAAKAISADPNKKLVLCACGKPCEAVSETTYKTRCSDCIMKKASKYTGYLYEKSNSEGILKRFWYTINGPYLHRIYYAKTHIGCQDRKGAVQKMYSLIGSFVKDEIEEVLPTKVVLYPFSILFGETQVHLYALKKEEKTGWLAAFREALNYSSLADFYDIKEPIGKGKFGLVRAAISREKGNRVAVKIIKKSSLSSEDMGLIRREIEILKLCQHPNIILLHDIFENTEYIYIVMELMRGGDLYNYLETRKFKTSRTRSRNIVHSLATALFYLHSYGIIHRDIKLDNVIMIDESDDSDVKIVDFGLSKLIGPNEKCMEPYGTYGFVAPEVLLGNPYDKQVDVWSLGVIAYTLLSGQEPFVGTSTDEISKRTITQELDFHTEAWRGISHKAKDCVSSKRHVWG